MRKTTNISLIPAILTGVVVIIIAVALIAFLSSTADSGLGKAKNAIDDWNRVAEKYPELQSSVGQNISGKELVKMLNSEHPDLKYTVKTIEDADGKVYAPTTGTSASTTAYSITSRTDADYINPTALFLCEVSETSNDVVVGLTFTQQK